MKFEKTVSRFKLGHYILNGLEDDMRLASRFGDAATEDFTNLISRLRGLEVITRKEYEDSKANYLKSVNRIVKLVDQYFECSEAFNKEAPEVTDYV